MKKTLITWSSFCSRQIRKTIS